jgi:hypothetical protein
MALIPTLLHLFASFVESAAQREQRYLSAAADSGDLERRLAQLDNCKRRQARGVVAGLYPR